MLIVLLMKKRNRANFLALWSGRSGETWTRGLMVPNHARYQLRYTSKIFSIYYYLLNTFSLFGFSIQNLTVLRLKFCRTHFSHWTKLSFFICRTSCAFTSEFSTVFCLLSISPNAVCVKIFRVCLFFILFRFYLCYGFYIYLLYA